ncbi:MAG: hypothetical protein CME19_19290 [Gemmatimonadetes bacterium]|nr:hypothetical protein [Gemmatimonadota bacterium]
MSEAPTYPSLVESVEETVAATGERYGLELQVDAPPRLGYRSTILFLCSEAGQYVLKVVGTGPEPGLESTAECQAFLKETGQPVVSPVRRRDGVFWGDVSGAYACLYPRADGQAWVGWSADRMRSAGSTLARVHRLPAESLNIANTAPSQEARSVIERSEQVDGPVDLRTAVLGDVDWGTTFNSILHRDYRAQNVLFAGEEAACVLDWDDAAIGDRLLDLAYSLVYFQAVVGEPPTVPSLRPFISGYADIFPLTDDDWSRLPDFLLLALYKGLALWSGLWAMTSSANTKERVEGWIQAYIALADTFEDTVEGLRG